MHKPCIRLFGAGLRAMVGDKREQDRKNHEHDGSAEHPLRPILVHDPAKQQRADDAAEVEAGGDDTECAPSRAWGCRVANQHVARGGDHASKESRRRHRRHQQQRGQIDCRNDKHDGRVNSKTGGGDLSVAPGAVGQQAAGQHADRTGAEERRQRKVGG